MAAETDNNLPLPPPQDPNSNGEQVQAAAPSKFKSIRRTSFAEAYFDIKELDDDDDQSSGDNVSSLDELDVSKLTEEGDGEWPRNSLLGNDSHVDDDNRISDLTENIDDDNRVNIDESTLNNYFMNAASNRETVKAGNTSRPNSFDSSRSTSCENNVRDIHNNFEAQQQQLQLPPKEAPVFHSTQRRKGSIERRMLLKGGLKRHTADGVLSKKYSGDNDNIGDNDDDMSASITASTLRRNSTGTNSRFAKQAHHDSMDSLASFASFATFGSGTSGNSGEGEAVGNLTFVTDVEMLSIMYENDDDGNDDNNNVDSRNSTATYNSLPPSAILGKGATSMVRLAWRKSNKPNSNGKRASSLDTNSDTEDNEAAAAAAMKITPDLKAIAARNEYRPTGQKAKSRRSVIRVISQPSIDNRSISSSKGDLVAVKLIQKSVLKQMKTMTRDSASNRVTVSTAFDNIEREIAMMKRLRHPNLVQLFEVIDSVESDKLYMVLEYVSLGEILSHVEGTDTYRRMRYKSKVKGLTPGGYFDEDNAALYFVDIMHGLAYLHR
eukprot:scaffold77224_cov57-Cyclotella_meneghiniana.AAC.5